jgi:predicted amidohydrolase YtcJ
MNSLLIFNATIVDEAFQPTPFRGLRIHGGKVVSFLTASETMQDGERARLDARGGLVLPSFCDSHIHLLDFGLRLKQLDLTQKSLAESLRLIEQAVNTTPDGQWILGGGWMKTYFGDFPTATALDRLSTRHFIALRSQDWHAVWCNTPALNRLAGQTFSDAELPKDSDGHIIGLAFERAAQKIFSLPEFSDSEKRAALLSAQTELFRFGVTEVLSMEHAADLAHYHALGGALKLRVGIAVYLESLQEAKSFYAAHPETTTKLLAAKLFLDGSLGAETCSLLNPFEGSTQRGIDLYADADLPSLFRLVEREGLFVSVHAIGDRAVRRALNAFETLKDKRQYLAQLRHRIEHAQMIHRDDVHRFAALNVVASMQPVHIKEDIATAARLLGKRTNRLYPFRSLLNSGATLLFGSDAPIETPNVFEGLYYAVERRDRENHVWHGDETLSLSDALHAYTSTPRDLVGASMRGTLVIGADADLVIVTPNIFATPTTELRSTEVLATIVRGEIVYSKI